MSNQRNADKDREIISAATIGPWEMYGAKVGRHDEILIGTRHADPQMKAPRSIVGHAHGVDGEYVYIKPSNGLFIVESYDAWPHWLERAVSAEQRVAELNDFLIAIFRANNGKLTIPNHIVIEPFGKLIITSQHDFENECTVFTGSEDRGE